jgi:hypothetical protein
MTVVLNHLSDTCPAVKPKSLCAHGLRQFAPGSAPALLATLGIDMPVLTRREEKVFSLRTTKSFSALPEFRNRDACVIVAISGGRDSTRQEAEHFLGSSILFDHFFPELHRAIFAFRIGEGGA